jgi:predicted phosphohydrolase
MKRYVWYSDPHLNMSVLPWMKRFFVNRLEKLHADGLFLSGDISSGKNLESDLRFLARNFNGPIYFVLGNHDYHGRYIDSVHSDVRRLCDSYSNLHWLTESPIISLNQDVALIGAEGWYDALSGDPDYLKYTTDWFLTSDFRALDDMNSRIEMFRHLAEESANKIETKLLESLETHKTVFIVTHFPPWKEATRAVGTKMEKFWLPYNANTILGQRIEKVMEGRKKKRVIVLAGHTHTPCKVRVSNSIECVVARASYFGSVRPEETIIV